MLDVKIFSTDLYGSNVIKSLGIRFGSIYQSLVQARMKIHNKPFPNFV